MRDVGDEPAEASIEDEKQEGSGDVEKLEEDAVEFQKPKMPSAVYSPSKAEMEEHIMTACATYRSWCPHCVASQSKGNPHKVSGEASDVPTLAFLWLHEQREGRDCNDCWQRFEERFSCSNVCLSLIHI